MNLPPLRTLFFAGLSVGMTETLEKTLSSTDVVGFAELAGDRNPRASWRALRLGRYFGNSARFM